MYTPIAPSAPPAMLGAKASYVDRGVQSMCSATAQCITMFMVLACVLGACVWSYFFCVPCLFAVSIVCACFACYAPYLLIPLWVSLGLLVLLGWNFTAGHFVFTWK